MYLEIPKEEQMISTDQIPKKQAYHPPHLEEHQWLSLTGIPLSFGGVLAFPDEPLEDFFEPGEQQ
jgi:hypothetical protein